MPISTPSIERSGFSGPVAAAINHLLAQEPWARKALMRHVGKQALIEAGSVCLRLRVAADGMLEADRAEHPANVTIRIKLSDLPLIVQNSERAFSYVKIEGDAEFANTVSQLSRGLRWEAEHDLERLFGPIAATRLAGGARSVVESVKATHRKVTENLAEYFLEEKPVLIRPAVVEEMAGEVSRLRDDVERAAKRLAKLEQKLAPRSAGDVTTTRGSGPTHLDH